MKHEIQNDALDAKREKEMEEEHSNAIELCRADAARKILETHSKWREETKERWGGAEPVRLADTILQVATHTGHHRGQVITRLRALGGDPPLVDFIVWVSAGKPDAIWPE